MKERPILFNGPMIRATLNSEKTQTRRIIKPQPVHNEENKAWYWDWNPEDRRGVAWADNVDPTLLISECPYGAPGDRLWVRETWRMSSEGNNYLTGEKRLYVEYRAGVYPGNGQRQSLFRCPDDDDVARRAWGRGRSGVWRPSIFMPRWASRIDLENTNIRAERVQDISEDDAIAEGTSIGGSVTLEELRFMESLPYQVDSTIPWFARLWNSINAKPKPIYRNKQIDHYVSFPFEGMAETIQHRGKPLIVTPNPFVWVVEFKLVKP